MSHIFHHEDYQEGYAEGYAVGAYEAQKNMVAAMFFQAGVYFDLAESNRDVEVAAQVTVARARKMHMIFLSLPRP